MKILFFMRSTVYVRNFESTLRLLAERDHDVHIIADPHFLADANELVERLCRAYPQIRHSPAPVVPFDASSLLGFELRRAIDYLRYLGPEFAQASKLRRRAERNAPEFIGAALRLPLFASAVGRSVLRGVLHWCDRALPRQPAIDDFIRTQNPDLVLVTPLIEPGSPQAVYLRSARALGIRTGLCVYSWDNLTNKGLIQDRLDLVTVWNEAMKKEAVTLHKVPRHRVVVTGATPYDHWFAWNPRRTRDDFCARAGVRADRPFLLYLCSSKFIAPNETAFVRQWVNELRTGPTVLRDAGVLVRPHPQNAQQWATAILDDLGQVVVWPRAGATPVDEDSRADYYDSIFHSAAVVGVNTSGQIESAIVGRGVYTVLAPEFRETQEGTLHFRHLRQANGGLLHVAQDFHEHIGQLAAAITGQAGDDRQCRRFVEAFVRPNGIDVAATPLLVSALEGTAARGRVRRDRGPWWAFLVRPQLAQWANRVARSDSARKEKAERQEQLRAQRKESLIARRAAARASKQRAEAERGLRKKAAEERLAAERLARAATAERAYDDYLRVRDRVRLMRNGHTIPLTLAEERMITGLAPLWNAAPADIACLRRLCEPISGVRPSDYDTEDSDLPTRLRHELRGLWRQVGRDLFVEEPEALGGFGLNKHGERYNEDTVKFFNVLVALQQGALLGAFRCAPTRRLVWEIGGGWGGFAYQFKTVCPNVTYLISGIPDLFLISAVYLRAVLPGARIRFLDDVSRGDLWRDWQDADFIFVPETSLPLLSTPPIDLTLDLLALRSMGDARRLCHVRRAFELGSRYFYSLLPRGAAGEDKGVWTAIERLYWPHPVPPRTNAEPTTLTGESPPSVDDDYAHLIGWRRLIA